MPGPEGLGLYLRHLTVRRHGSPAKLAAQLADHGISWVAIGGPWHDRPSKGNRWINKPERIIPWADALIDAGVRPHIWGYPWHDRINEFVDDMIACSDSDGIHGWLLDPELGLKKHPAKALELFHKSRAALNDINPYNLLGMTSYGIPRGHRSFPFEAFAEQGTEGDPFKEVDYGSPQLYFLPEKRVKEGLEEWSKLGYDEIIPSFGTYTFVQKDSSKPFSSKNRRAISKTPSQLEAHLGHFVDSSVPVWGMIGWAYNFVDRAQWPVLARWADRLARGVFALPDEV